MKKRCGVCGEEKELEEFNKSACRKDGLQSHCKKCSRERFRIYYERNHVKQKRYVMDRNKKVLVENRKRLLDYLRHHSCVDCGEADPIVLEFDHLRDKIDNVSTMMKAGNSWTRLLKEIEKCEVCCANCHRRRTSKRNGSYRTRT